MYSRFTALENYSQCKQEKLENSTAAVVGLGATGSAIAENLARHGVKLIIIDRDYLEEKDIYSSSLYDLEQCKKSLPKAKAAKNKLEDLTSVEAYSESLSPEKLDLISSADIILDGADNLETRKIINGYSKKKGIPWVYTAAIAKQAYSMPFVDKCFNCIVGSSTDVATCETEGIMREWAQRAAAASSKKAVKYLTFERVNESLEILHKGRELYVESAGCEVCEGESFPYLTDSSSVRKVCGSGKFQIEKKFDQDDLDLAGEVIVENQYLTRLKYEGRELVFFNSGRIIVEAEDEGHAEALVSKVAGL